MAYIYLNNTAVSLASEPQRCCNPISHLHQALIKLSQSQSSQAHSPDAQPKVHDQQERQECCGDEQYITIQEGAEPSVSTPSYDEGIGAFSQPLFLQPSCTHRETIESTILFNLGLAYCSINEDYDEGLVYLEEALCVTQQIPSTSEGPPCQNTILHNIGRLHFLAGRYTKAIKAYSHILTDDFSETMEAFSKSDSFRTASTLNCIAVCRLYSLDEDTYPSGQTLLLLRQALSIHTNVLSCCADISKNTSRSMALAKATIINNIGRALYQQEDFSRALSMYTKASILRKALLGKDHLDVAVSFYNMADAHCCLGNDSEAISGYDTYVSIASVHLGYDHPDIASVLTTVGQLYYYKMNDCLRAMRYLSHALSSSVCAYADEKVAIVYNILGSASFEAGYLDIALKSFQAGLKIEREIGLSTNDIVTTLSNIGNTLSLQGSLDEALVYYQEACEEIEKTRGPSEETVAIKSKIALVHQKQERYSDAERELKAVLELCKSLYGTRSLKEASTWNLLGLLYYDQRAYKQALECFSTSLSIRMERSSEPCVTDLSTLYSNIARAYKLLGDVDQALHYYEESYRMLVEGENAFATDDNNDTCGRVYAKHTLSTLQDIALVYQEKGEMGKALQSLRKAFAFFVKHEGLISNIDRSGLYSSFEVYYLNLSQLRCNADVIVSKHCAPAA